MNSQFHHRESFQICKILYRNIHLITDRWEGFNKAAGILTRSGFHCWNEGKSHMNHGKSKQLLLSTAPYRKKINKTPNSSFRTKSFITNLGENQNGCFIVDEDLSVLLPAILRASPRISKKKVFFPPQNRKYTEGHKDFWNQIPPFLRKGKLTHGLCSTARETEVNKSH